MTHCKDCGCYINTSIEDEVTCPLCWGRHQMSKEDTMAEGDKHFDGHHFKADVCGNGNSASIVADRVTGITTTAKASLGAVRTTLYYCDGEDWARVVLRPYRCDEPNVILYNGPIARFQNEATYTDSKTQNHLRSMLTGLCDIERDIAAAERGEFAPRDTGYPEPELEELRESRYSLIEDIMAGVEAFRIPKED